MPLDSTINNVGEFYAAHYLEHQFIKDIAAQAKAWRDLGSRGVPRRLLALSDEYFRAKAQALDGVSEPNGWHGQLLGALGYTVAPGWQLLVAERASLPILSRATRYGKPWLVVAETPFWLPDSPDEPLEIQVPPGIDPAGTHHLQTSWGEAVGRLLREEDSPRWVMLLSGSLIHLFDRSTFAQGRWLRFDLDTAFGIKETATFEAMAALLAAETLCPNADSTPVLHDTLEGQSHRFTHGVSTRLQSAVRRAIEQVCNGWVDFRRASKLSYTRLTDSEPAFADGSREITAERLRHEALVFVYRILFCLYAEARGGELGILPINDDIYRLGYSLEALRDLADAGDVPIQAEAGTYYHAHLKTLFKLIHKGFRPAVPDHATQPWLLPGREQLALFPDERNAPRQLRLDQAGRKVIEAEDDLAQTFIVRPLTATLFDPAATPLLDRADLPNLRLQRVIRALSLGTDEKGKTIGRINYAELGIVQLGAVYEGLLSFTGFFASERLIQVHRALGKPKANGNADGASDADTDDTSDAEDENEVEDEEAAEAPAAPAGGGPRLIFDDDIPGDVQTWFVPEARLRDFQPGQIIVERTTQRARVYLPGEFILHLNGVDRAKSASYYTPELLTRALVREVLAERLAGFTPADADRILTLTVCEPAMGSAAFINAMCDALAHEYLRLKQAQIGQVIEPGRYDDELRRVKHYIATRNVYGVDLNPTAVALGGLSLWLGSMHRLLVRKGDGPQPDVYRTGAVPWFGLRLRVGNSLIGARRAVWTSEQLRLGQYYGKNAATPRMLRPGEARGPGEIYHFLVWSEDMLPAYRDQQMKAFWADVCALGTNWIKKQVRVRWSTEDIDAALAISAGIDALWARYAEQRAAALEGTACTATVWPLPSDANEARRSGPSLEEQEETRCKLEATSGPFQRLQLIMDTWCALYFWPLESASALPSRPAWLAALKILCGIDVDSTEGRSMLAIRLGIPGQLEKLFASALGDLPDVDQLCQAMPSLEVGRTVAELQRFHHWELVFTEVLGLEVNGQPLPQGIDLMVGNPPWIRVEWTDAPLLAEFDPALGVKAAKSAALNAARIRLLAAETNRVRYRQELESQAGIAAFLNDHGLYSLLVGIQTNLFKNFICRIWDLLGESGIAGLLHPEGVFDDSKGGIFREAYYRRLRAHYQFENGLNLFKGTNDHGRMKFSLNIFAGVARAIHFTCAFNLYHPATLDQCRAAAPPGSLLPGMKTNTGHWETAGHPDRLISVTESTLKEMARLFEDGNTPPGQARLPQIHGKPILSIINKIGQAHSRLGSFSGTYFPTVMFEEDSAQRKGIITRCENPTYQPRDPGEVVLSGPLIHVGRPWNKTPRSICTANSHYDDVDLTEISDEFLPRTVYRPGDASGDRTAFANAIGYWPAPSLPGFWPIPQAQQIAWELLCREPLHLYCTTPGMNFAYFVQADGDIREAVHWLERNDPKDWEQERSRRFSKLRITQGIPDKKLVAHLPRLKTAYFRHVNRRKAKPSDSRTLIATIVPPSIVHLDAVFSISFLDEQILLSFSGSAFSIVYDFICRQIGKEDLRHDVIATLPLLDCPKTALIATRALRLVAITCHYAALWERSVTHTMRIDSWTTTDPRLSHELELPWSALPDNWERGCALRSDFARRQALLELDVLVAQALDLTLEELLTIYNVQFPAVRQFETIDEYDAKGRRLPNTSRKDAGAKELREARKSHDGLSPLTVSWPIDNGNARVTRTFHPPFTRVDREDDYRRAWTVFAERLGGTREAP